MLAIDFVGPEVTGVATVSLMGLDVFGVRQDFLDGHLLAAVRELFAGAWVAAMKDPQSLRIEREFAFDAQAQPPDDNLEGLRSVMQQAFARLGRHIPR